ncbi:MAG: DHHA1 domain-containing protein [Oscillospiraceae bacterium]
MFAQKAQALAGAGNVLLFEPAMNPDSLRRLTDLVMSACGGRAAVFAGSDADGYKYAVGEQDGDLRQLVKELNAQLHGRGGGKPFFAQGSVQAGRAEIEVFFAGR